MSTARYERLDGSPQPPAYSSGDISSSAPAEKMSHAQLKEAAPSRFAVFCSVSFYLVAALVVRATLQTRRSSL
jgi:hypothetical protein